MNKYESVIIINPDISEDAYKEVINKISEVIKGFSKTSEKSLVVKEVGKKKLAYEIRKCKTGFYVSFEFKANSTKISELERKCRITDEIIKFITVRREDNEY